MKKKVLSILSLSAVLWIHAQEKDTLDQKKIEEVVITGQYMQQSINKSIYKVEVIDAQQIKNMAVTTAAEVLNQNLNILIEPSRGSGDSSANIMGLTGEYTKILIDNIPVVSDQGMGNLVDLTKLNVNNIERIEIVKGSMGVEYGNNAVAGVINIITKKNYSKKFTGIASLQEETVGKDYDWFKKGNGRHIQFLNLGYKINDNWTIAADINHNDFQGFKGRYNGYKYFSENNDGLRGYDWQPKDQLTTNASIRYNKNNTTFYYKVNFLTEKINVYNPVIEELYVGGGNRTYIANDADYKTKRWIHQFNIQTKIGSRINYNGDFSYQTQERKKQEYQYDVPNRQELSRGEDFTYYKSEVMYSRGMFSNFLDSDRVNFQIGYELDRTKGFASGEIGDFGSTGNDDVNRTIFNYANFLSAEWNVNSWLSLRPGVRLALSNKFDSQYNYSATARFKTTQNSDIRLVFGSANRFPTYDELYTYMVDNNHDIRGNENLKPETGYSAGIFWDYTTATADNWKFNFSASGMYLDVKDRIESVIISNSPLKYTYLNVDNYKSLLFGGSITAKKGDLSLNAGVSVLGISQGLNTGNITSPDDYNFYAEANLAANYTLPYTQTLFALYYKYTGTKKMFTHQVNAQDPLDPGQYILGTIDDFSMLNFTVSQPFFNNHLELSAGIKNIFDVSTIRNTVQGGDGHNAAANQQNLFYGRSYFARLNYNF
ncbi:TonB-dependent receptor plug domain-containing protein [Chryseobacterium daecheongense]|uniref:Outer membrane receptor for ferrienterochelin and colicins n=1 Tax=Chryseobacterium daecheongense TaxID=192389 RepID=A0A3N0VZA1_9FLAO|nr:TonB-dependent receptor [Chryseobacterium daecheongense]ROH98109.1 TonB-dependent receptor [Chryseobacterium daecheongense]TDX92690.1 outer membrane receptor for ferrienterochelin and colicins [Chryseobacterium daecheongense]